MFNLTRPKFVAPFHGEPRMMYAYTDMVCEMGMDRARVLWMEIGDLLSLDGEKAEFLDPIASCGSVLVDGVSESGVSEIILRDRRHLADNGAVIVTVGLDRSNGEIIYGPDLISRGFLHPEQAETIFEEARLKVIEILESLEREEDIDFDNVRATVRDTVQRFLKKQTRRRPVVVPVIMEI